MVVGMSSAAHAQWLPAGSRFSGGLGWNLLASHPTQPRDKCIDHGPVVKIHGATSASFQVKLAKDRKELYQHLRLSIDAEVSFGVGHASASTSLDRKASFSSDSVTFVASFDVEFGVWGIERWSLLPTYASASPTELFKKCGDAVITRQRRGATVAVIYSARGLTSDERSKLMLAFEGGTLTASAKSKFSQELRRIRESASVQTQVYATGGVGPEVLGDLMKDGALDKVRSVMADYVKKLDPENAATLEYGLQPIGNADLSKPPVATDLLVAILDTEAEIAHAATCPPTRVDEGALSKLRTFAQALADAWKPCAERGDCKVPTGRPTEVACKPPYAIHVETWTGTGKKHGTDDVVHLVLSDSKGIELKWRLNTPGRDDFQVRAKGGDASDRFLLKNDQYLADIKCAELQLSPKKKGAKKLNDWHLSKIVIRRDSIAGQQLYTFGADKEHAVIGDGRATWRKCR